MVPLVPPHHGTRVPWRTRTYTSVVPWYTCVRTMVPVVPWYRGTYVLCTYQVRTYVHVYVPWYHGTMVPWYTCTYVRTYVVRTCVRHVTSQLSVLTCGRTYVRTYVLPWYVRTYVCTMWYVPVVLYVHTYARKCNNIVSIKRWIRSADLLSSWKRPPTMV